MDFQIGSKHFAISISFVLGVILALWLFFRLGGPDLQLDQWAAGGKIEHQTVQKLLASHRTYVSQSSAARRKLSDSIRTVLQVVKTQQEGGAMLLQAARTADQFKTAAETLAKAGAVCADGLVLCKTRGDSLFRDDSLHTDSLRVALLAADTTLQRGLKAASCHVLLVLPCLSRTQSVEVGGVAGLIIGYVIFHP